MKFLHPDGSVTADLPYKPTDGPYQRLIARGFKPITNEAAFATAQSSIVAASDEDRCIGITQLGKRCKKRVIGDHGYCADHLPRLVEDSPADEPIAAIEALVDDSEE